MQATIPDVLARIVERKKDEVAAKAGSREVFVARANQPRRDFRAALTRKTPAIIAEIKKASPSKGILAEYFDPVQQAVDYTSGGAAALSVLTDRDYFQGSLEDLVEARKATHLPVLRKDFTIDHVDVVEAAAHGADAVLLIAAILTRDELRDFRALAAWYQMAALVEVHTEGELDAALESGAEIIGVNNRDLHTFTVKLETSLRLAARIPANVIKVAESGIHSPDDVRRLAGAGYQAVLVGEHLMRAGRPAEALRALLA